jgi:subtilisin family serine protease
MASRWRILGSAVLLVIGVAGAAQAEQDPFQKNRQGRLSDALNVRALTAEHGGRAPGLRASSATASDNVVAVVEMQSASDRAAVAAELAARGGRVLAAVDHLMKVELAASQLRAFSETRGIVRMRLPITPSAKEVVSEGVSSTHAREFSSRTGATGAGVTVGILDGSFARAGDFIGSELPDDIAGTDSVRAHLGSYTGVHGTACAEIVHDMAPDADIVLADFTDDVTWAQSVDQLVGSGIRIISHSIGFDNIYPPDGNNYYAQKVDQAAGAGVLFVTAAGNEGHKYYNGTWRDANGNGLMEFGTSGSEMLPVGAGAPQSKVVLRWDDPFGTSTHDYDLLIVSAGFADDKRLSRDNPNILAVSADLQAGAADPREILDFTVPSDQVVYVVVLRDPSSPVNTAQHFWVWAQDEVSPALGSSAGSLTLPGDARGALTVGAVQFGTTSAEGFSSRGPTMDGRTKPDIAGPDGVTTAAYDGQPFFGTSAATPHVAGAAALILSRNPSLNAQGLRTALEQATSSGGRTRNNDLGTGVLDLNLVH